MVEREKVFVAADAPIMVSTVAEPKWAADRLTRGPAAAPV
jgi:hypothetical protein